MVYSNTAVYGVRVRVRVMIGFVVKIRISVRVRVGVTFNSSIHHWSNCRRSKLNVVHSFIVSNGELCTHGITQLPTLKNYSHEWI